MKNVQVRLRAVEPEDVDFMYMCEADRQNSLWSDCRAPLSKHQLIDYALGYEADPFKAGQLRLIIETFSEGEKKPRAAGILDIYEISAADSKGYVGICIHPDFRRRGIAEGALTELLVFNRVKLGLHNLVAKISEENEAALRLFEKCGFSPIALLPSWHRIGLSFHNFHLLQINPHLLKICGEMGEIL